MRLILTDIDDTIMPWGRTTVSDRMRAAFHAALDAGHVIGPCSGRGRLWIPPFFGGDEACYATAVCTNGMEVYHEGALLYKTDLPHAALAHMAEVVAEFPHAGFLCFVGTTPMLVTGSADDCRPLFPAYADACVPVAAVPDEPVVKANVFVGGGPQAHRELVARLNAEVAELDTDLARPGFSNVMLRGFNKGSAVERLRRHLGVAPEEVFVFGDADNDLPMFKTVVNSVAMGNATPEAAAAARWHIGDVRDDAAADAIEALAAGEFPFTR